MGGKTEEEAGLGEGPPLLEEGGRGGGELVLGDSVVGVALVGTLQSGKKEQCKNFDLSGGRFRHFVFIFDGIRI